MRQCRANRAGLRQSELTAEHPHRRTQHGGRRPRRVRRRHSLLLTEASHRPRPLGGPEAVIRSTRPSKISTSSRRSDRRTRRGRRYEARRSRKRVGASARDGHARSGDQFARLASQGHRSERLAQETRKRERRSSPAAAESEELTRASSCQRAPRAPLTRSAASCTRAMIQSALPGAGRPRGPGVRAVGKTLRLRAHRPALIRHRHGRAVRRRSAHRRPTHRRSAHRRAGLHRRRSVRGAGSEPSTLGEHARLPLPSGSLRVGGRWSIDDRRWRWR